MRFACPCYSFSRCEAQPLVRQGDKDVVREMTEERLPPSTPEKNAPESSPLEKIDDRRHPHHMGRQTHSVVQAQ